MWSILALLLPLCIAAAGDAEAAPALPSCPGGRFLVARQPNEPALIGAAAAPEAIEVQGLGSPPGLIEISSGCGRILVNVKATKKGAVLRAAWPANGCRGEATVRLKATVDAACLMSGTIKKKKQKPVRFTAPLSVCGDAILDAEVEQCDGSGACAGGGTCGSDCRCTRPSTSTTVRPAGSTSTTLPGTTVTTSTSSSSTAAGATSTIVGTTTSTTSGAGASCQQSGPPTCGGTCGGNGIGCTSALCAAPDRPCTAHDECATNFCVFFGDFGFCADAESCGPGDEECATGLCVTYDECFCWYP
jgi:hypothetical protein